MENQDNTQFTVFVGNLPWSMSDESLKDTFESRGIQVKNSDNQESFARIVRDKFSGRSKGFGFVTLVDQENYQLALNLNGIEIDGRNIIVQPKQQKTDSDRSQSFGRYRHNNFNSRNSGQGRRDGRFNRNARKESYSN